MKLVFASTLKPKLESAVNVAAFRRDEILAAVQPLVPAGDHFQQAAVPDGYLPPPVP